METVVTIDALLVAAKSIETAAGELLAQHGQYVDTDDVDLKKERELLRTISTAYNLLYELVCTVDNVIWNTTEEPHEVCFFCGEPLKPGENVCWGCGGEQEDEPF